MSAPGLYVHVPFCARACPYCDFDFEVGRGAKLQARIELYFEGLELELAARALHGPVRTLYVGGGTPSALGPRGLEALFSLLDGHVQREACVEQSVELNPEHVDEDLLDALSRAGVGRVSLGVQSLHSPVLAELGRVHSAERAIAAIAACKSRFETSVDLIVGSPGMPERPLSVNDALAQLDRDLEQLVELRVDHLSLYALTIEDSSNWPGLVQRGQRSAPDPDAQAEVLEGAEKRLQAAGFVHYEVASYGRPGHEARHNSLYWESQNYVGIGPSAHSAKIEAGRVNRRANARGLDAWFAAKGHADQEELLEGQHAASEALWLALRRLDGMSVGAYLASFPQVDLAWLRSKVRAQVAKGNLEWLEEDRGALGPGLRVAPGRWLWHDSIGEALLGA